MHPYIPNNNAPNAPNANNAQNAFKYAFPPYNPYFNPNFNYMQYPQFWQNLNMPPPPALQQNAQGNIAIQLNLQVLNLGDHRSTRYTNYVRPNQNLDLRRQSNIQIFLINGSCRIQQVILKIRINS